MKTEKIKDIAYYQSLPYTITIRKDDEGDFIARIQELSGCIAHGETEAAAVEMLRSIQRLWIEEALSVGNDIPEPEDDAELPSGKWVQRVPRKLHRDLTDLAKRDGVSLNHLVTSMLSQALTARSCIHTFETSFEAIISSVQTHLSGGVINHLVWTEPMHELEPWSMRPHRRLGPIAHELNQVTNLKPSRMLFDAYADEHTESRRLATSK